jgi:hypothetical protein
LQFNNTPSEVREDISPCRRQVIGETIRTSKRAPIFSHIPGSLTSELFSYCDFVRGFSQFQFKKTVEVDVRAVHGEFGQVEVRNSMSWLAGKHGIHDETRIKNSRVWR